MNCELQVKKHNGIYVVSSRVVAKELDKRHNNVVRDLDKILENSHLSSLIIPSFYRVSNQKRQYKEYLLTKDGFTLYMFNIQGHNDFKMAYINKFNEMEKELKNDGNISLENLVRKYCIEYEKEKSEEITKYKEKIAILERREDELYELLNTMYLEIANQRETERERNKKLERKFEMAGMLMRSNKNIINQLK